MQPVRLRHLVLIVLAWAAVTLPGLGAGGLVRTEGHRVVPAVGMLEGDGWLAPRMFGRAYLRKPPGGAWAFAGATGATGDRVLGPRLVSAGALLGLSMGSWWFGRRWFGPGAGLAAGLATALTPMFFEYARAAELEMLNNLFAALAAWIVVELVTRRACRPALAALALGACTAGMMLVKGPAGWPAPLGMLVGAAWAGRSWRVLGTPRVWAGLAAGSAAFAAVWWAIERSVEADAVRQLPTAFLFEPGRLGAMALFVPSVFVAALPLSLAALFPWGPDAREEADEGGREAVRRLGVARTLGLGAAAGVVLLLAVGVSNPRYAQPVVATLGPLAGWAVAGAGRTGVFGPLRRRIGRAMLLGSPAAMACVLLAGALLFSQVIEPRRRAGSGEPVGRAAAAACADAMRAATGPVVIAADGVIGARPETLLAFQEAARELGAQVEVRWITDLAQITQFDITHPDVALVVLRRDAGMDETGAFASWGVQHTGEAGRFVFEWRLRPDR